MAAVSTICAASAQFDSVDIFTAFLVTGDGFGSLPFDLAAFVLFSPATGGLSLKSLLVTGRMYSFGAHDVLSNTAGRNFVQSTASIPEPSAFPHN